MSTSGEPRLSVEFAHVRQAVPLFRTAADTLAKQAMHTGGRSGSGNWQAAAAIASLQHSLTSMLDAFHQQLESDAAQLEGNLNAYRRADGSAADAMRKLHPGIAR